MIALVVIFLVILLCHFFQGFLDLFPDPSGFLMVQSASCDPHYQLILHINARKIEITLIPVAGYVYVNPLLLADPVDLII